jgi:hypothetical protein
MAGIAETIDGMIITRHAQNAHQNRKSDSAL